MIIRLLDKQNINEFKKIYKIMEESFPKNEFRTYDDQKKLLDKKNYKIFLSLSENSEIIGFLTVYEYPDFIFIEHLAVDSKSRSLGIGKELLRYVCDKYDLTVFLEVELPGDNITIRRINFYERNGFYINDFDYYQPPIRKTEDKVDLRIMTYGKKIHFSEFVKFRKTVYNDVYSYNEE